jgi:hypothetical protein
MDNVRRFIVKNLWWPVLLTALVLLVCHTLGIKRVTVDNTSLILLLVVLISPFIAAIRKVKIGDFEAEIQPDEVRRVARQAEKSLPPEPSGDFVPLRTSEANIAIQNLVETDPVVALAKLRIELETRIRRIDQRLNSSNANRKRPAPLAYLIRDLASHEVFAPEFGASLRDVISICNRAVHGEDIRDVDARQIINTGVELLDVLERTARDYAATHPVETTVITPEERDQLTTARYRLTTVVPLTDKPERRVYLFTQEEIDAFLESYPEYAEFIVGLERVQ